MDDFVYSHTICHGIVVDQICGTLRPNFEGRRDKCLMIGPNKFDDHLREFHIEILSMTEGAAVTFGVCPADYEDDSQIGWGKKSVGYHSDDGGIFIEAGGSSVSKPTFGAGDTLGCYLDVQTNTLKFSKNHEIVYETKIGFAYNALYPGIVIGYDDTCVSLVEKEVWVTSNEQNNWQCIICDEGEETVGKCIECNECLCQACLDRHKQGKKTRFHTILMKDEMDKEKEIHNQVYCSSHDFEVFSRYCSTCSKLICAECLNGGKHKDHVMARIEDLAQIKREKVGEVTKTAKEKSRPVRRVVDSMSTLITRRAKFLREMITKAEHELLHLNAAVVGDMEKAIGEGESIFQSHTDTRILARDAHMTSLIEEIEKTIVPLKFSQFEVDEKLLAKPSEISEPNENEAN